MEIAIECECIKAEVVDEFENGLSKTVVLGIGHFPEGTRDSKDYEKRGRWRRLGEEWLGRRAKRQEDGVKSSRWIAGAAGWETSVGRGRRYEKEGKDKAGIAKENEGEPGGRRRERSRAKSE
jgi:hypothetical protein